MYAQVEWYDAKGSLRRHGVARACDLSRALSLIEGQGGKIRKYAQIRKVG